MKARPSFFIFYVYKIFIFILHDKQNRIFKKSISWRCITVMFESLSISLQLFQFFFGFTVPLFSGFSEPFRGLSVAFCNPFADQVA